MKFKKQDFDDAVEKEDLKLVKFDNLYLYNYTQQYHFSDVLDWPDFMLSSRGLIINWENNEVVSLPLPKFFNWFERGRYTRASIKYITEKMDGSCGILYRYDNEYKISTRGSFTSDQAVFATKYINDNYNLSLLPLALTLVFEIIYPENRIVVNYDYSDLILLTVINRFTGKELERYEIVILANQFNFTLVNQHNFNNITEILEKIEVLSSNEEGYVVMFSDGQRFKFKGIRYLEIHKIISNFTFKNIAKSWLLGSNYRNGLPEEFHNEYDSVIETLKTSFEYHKSKLSSLLVQSPIDSDRKTFAIWVINNASIYKQFMFQHYDNKFNIGKFMKFIVEVNERSNNEI